MIPALKPLSTDERDRENFILLTDAPPLPKGGFGNFTIAWNLLNALGRNAAVVVTHRYYRTNNRSAIRADLPLPTFLHPDFSHVVGLNQVLPLLRYLLDAAGCVAFLIRHRSLASKFSADRILALIGSEGAYLIAAWAAGHLLNRPVDIYLVDDLEASARSRGRVISAHFYHWLEKRVLPRAARVFAISQGYADHLSAKYGIDAKVLYLPLQDSPVVHIPATSDSVRRIGFSGSLNELYSDALITLGSVLHELNAEDADPPYRLSLAGLPPPESFTNQLPDASLLNQAGLLDRQQLGSWLASNRANILPYAFDPAVRTQVKTSFSSKLSEYLVSGRPIIVFGPADSSTVRHFREASLPLVCSTPEELKIALQELEHHDTPSLAESYEKLREKFHSPEAVRRHLHLT